MPRVSGVVTEQAERDAQTIKTFCRFCHAFCGMEADVVDNQIVALRGDADHLVSQGYSCSKGRAEIERITHPDRVLSAKKRVDGELVSLPSEKALDEIADRLNEIIAEHGPHSVAIYVGGGGHRTAAGGPWFSRRFLDGLGSRSMYTAFTIDSPSLPVAMTRLFGAPLPVQMLDLDHAEVAMFVGTNPLVSHFMTMPQPDPIRRLREAKRRGMYVIVVDPRRTETAKHADLYLQVKPGEDATLFAGMIKIVIEQGLYDHDYVAAYGSGLDALAAAVAPFDLDYVARRTGVPAALVREAATRFATAERGGAQTGTGVHMARRQVLSTQLVMVLNALCGRYDRRGGLTHHDGAIGIAMPPLDRPLRMPRYDGPTSRDPRHPWQLQRRRLLRGDAGEHAHRRDPHPRRRSDSRPDRVRRQPCARLPRWQVDARGVGQPRPAGGRRPVRELDGRARPLRARGASPLRARRRLAPGRLVVPAAVQPVHRAGRRSTARCDRRLGTVLGSRQTDGDQDRPSGHRSDERPDHRRDPRRPASFLAYPPRRRARPPRRACVG